MYLQITLPTISNDGDTVDISFINPTDGSYFYKATLAVNNEISFSSHFNDIDNSNNPRFYSAGDILSMYSDQKYVYFFINGEYKEKSSYSNLSSCILNVSGNSVNDTYTFSNVRFYPTGKAGTDGLPGLNGLNGYTFTTLVGTGGAVINTPVSYTLNNPTDTVSILESLDPTNEGLYMQVALPYVSESTNIVLRDSNTTPREWGVNIFKDDNVHYYSRLKYEAIPSIAANYAENAIFSMYLDGTTLYYYIDSIQVDFTTVIPSTPCKFNAYVQQGSSGLSETPTYGNVRFYPTGKLGPIGSTGPAGINGISGGAILILDTAGGSVTNGNPITGSLDVTVIPNNTQSSIVVSRAANPNGNTARSVGQFLTPPNFFTSGIIVSGLWDLNIYMSQPDYLASTRYGTVYYNLYEYDSAGTTRIGGITVNGLIVPGLISDGSSAFVTTAQQSQLQYTITNYVPTYTLQSTSSRLMVEIYATVYGNSTTTNLLFRNDTIAHLHTTLYQTPPIGSTGPTGATGPNAPTGPTGATGPIQPYVAARLNTSTVSGTSLTVSAATYTTYYYISNSGFNSLTLPAPTPTLFTSGDIGAYWVFRNTTSSYISITTLANPGTPVLTTPLVIPPGNSITIVITAVVFSTPNYVPTYTLF